MSELLPCDYCCEHFKKNLKKFPPDNYLDNNHNAFFYGYLLHDLVNQDHNAHRNGQAKKESPPFDEVKSFYFRAVGEECKDCKV